MHPQSGHMYGNHPPSGQMQHSQYGSDGTTSYSGAPYSNRDAFERMQITCKSIVDSAPQAVSTGEAVTPLGEVFGAVDMDQISDFLTGSKYENNARKILKLSEKGDPSIGHESVDLAKNVIASCEYHNAYVSYKKMEPNSEKKPTVHDGMVTYTSPINFFKAVYQIIEEPKDVMKSMIPVLHTLYKELLHKWRSDFVEVGSDLKTQDRIVSYNQYRAWKSSLSDPEMKKQQDKISIITKNIQTFEKLMKDYETAVKKIPDSFEPQKGFIPSEWKEFRKVTKQIRAVENAATKPKGNGKDQSHHENNGRGGGNNRPYSVHNHNHYHGFRPRMNAGIDSDWTEALGTGMPMEGGAYPLVSTGAGAPTLGSSLASGKNQGNMETSASRFCQCGPDCVPVPIHTGVASAAAGAVSGIVPRKPLAQQAPVKTASKDGDFCKCKDPLVETAGPVLRDMNKAVAMARLRGKKNGHPHVNSYGYPHVNSYRYPHGKSGRRNRHVPWVRSEYSDGTPLLF